MDRYPDQDKPESYQVCDFLFLASHLNLILNLERGPVERSYYSQIANEETSLQIHPSLCKHIPWTGSPWSHWPGPWSLGKGSRHWATTGDWAGSEPVGEVLAPGPMPLAELQDKSLVPLPQPYGCQ